MWDFEQESKTWSSPRQESEACIRFSGNNLFRSRNFESRRALHINLKSPIPDLKPKIVMPLGSLKTAFPRQSPGTRKIKFIYSELFLVDWGFLLPQNAFWRIASAFFLINRVRQLQFAPQGAMMFLQGFIFGSAVRSIGVPPDLNLYTL
ncbi:hypothetical protein QUB33_21425 [Microcoleus sp. B3-A4]|uniref:hypothetical protein n=1 Tax=Microcoleus sp. B3-A4 TaxID=2818653 RepID=UPI002FD47F18